MNKKKIKMADFINTEYDFNALKMMTTTIEKMYKEKSKGTKSDMMVISYFNDMKKILQFIDEVEFESAMKIN